MTDELAAAGEIIAKACGEYVSFTYRHEADPLEEGFRFGAFIYSDDEAFHGYGATLSDALAAAREERERTLALRSAPISEQRLREIEDGYEEIG